jgi:hypothetical protein
MFNAGNRSQPAATALPGQCQRPLMMDIEYWKIHALEFRKGPLAIFKHENQVDSASRHIAEGQ